MADSDDNQDIFSGLQAIAQMAFPKTCRMCNRVYASSEEYVRSTLAIAGKSGFKSAEEEDGSVVVELFRNCECGSTLMDVFHDRRDTSEQGRARREKFGVVLEQLVRRGVEPSVARLEMLKVLRGESSKLLEDMGVIKPKRG